MYLAVGYEPVAVEVRIAAQRVQPLGMVARVAIPTPSPQLRQHMGGDRATTCARRGEHLSCFGIDLRARRVTQHGASAQEARLDDGVADLRAHGRLVDHQLFDGA